MTQEELDALMSGDTQDISDDVQDDTIQETQNELQTNGDDNYRVSSNTAWPPPPPTSDHKMVQQLDDVTKDSEEKATQMFDQLDLINNFLVDIENVANDNKVVVESNIELFNKLCDKFPNVETFKEALDKNKKLLDEISDIMTKIQDGQNEIMNTMDMMQYQDIHRQKIERVINVMRALSKYMNSLFESSIDDKSRAPSAVHIQGDTSTESVMSDDDIEALINSLGKK